MDKKQQAQHLYMTQGMSQKQIAQIVGVSERTIYTWIHQHAWEQLKRAAYQAPALVADNFYSQVVEMQNLIASRELGSRFATQQEAEIMRKLLVCIEKTKKATSVTQSMQVLESFKNFTRNKDPKFTKTFANYTNEYLTGQALNTYVPFDLEYGVENVLPTMPFYDEPEAVPEVPEVVCPADGKICHHPGKCHYPSCTVAKVDDAHRSEDPLVRNKVIPIPAVTPETVKERYLKFMADKGFSYSEELGIHTSEPEKSGSRTEETTTQIEDNNSSNKDSVGNVGSVNFILPERSQGNERPGIEDAGSEGIAEAC